MLIHFTIFKPTKQKVIKLRVISKFYKLIKFLKKNLKITIGFCKTYEVKATTTIIILRWVDDLTRGG